MAMPELISIARPAGPARRYALTRGFAPVQAIVPASASGTTAAPAPVPVPARAIAPARASRSAAGSAEPRDGSASANPRIGGLGASTEPALYRSYLPAPPPISLRAPSVGPPVPDVARRAQAAPNAPVVPGQVAGPASLTQATAELFRSMRVNRSTDSLFDNGTGGRTVSVPNGYDDSPFDRGDGVVNFPRPDPEPVQPPAVPNEQLERLVDTVVERIEQRVIDELERRGRRHNPGVF
jgi:hypothetical protein